MRKNKWEKELFKREDEMYYTDLEIQHFKRVIRLLERTLTTTVAERQVALIEQAVSFKVI